MTKPYPDTHHDVTSNTLFGFWVYLMTDCILFASFFASYAVLKKPTSVLDLKMALFETLVLLLSSFTAGVAMLSKRKTMAVLWGVTFLLGALFLTLQVQELQGLLSLGISWTTSGFFSSFFSLIALHSLHLIAGLFMMIVFLLQLWMWGMDSMVERRLHALRIYWQFLYLVWIFTFSIVYLLGANS